MNFRTLTDKSKNLRVWWINKTVYFGMKQKVSYFYIDDIKEAQPILDILSAHDLQNDDIEYNTCGVEVFNFEVKEWEEWLNDDGEDFSELGKWNENPYENYEIINCAKGEE